MLLRSVGRISNVLSHLDRRRNFSSRISALFVNNFDKYNDRISGNRDTYVKKQLNKLLEDFSRLTTSIKDVDKELNSESPSDKELTGLMKEEKVELEVKQNELIAEVLNEIYHYELSNDVDRIPDSSSVLFEVSAGVGGKEAMLFANELCNLYINFFNHKRWDLVDVEADQQSEYLRHYRARVEGRDVWGFMRFEAGVHRVQRVPETDSKGRIHTSTVTIACIPITTDAGVEINEKDLKFQTKTASGAGGQHVNKTESAVRITHVPSGVMVECQEDRSQIKNRETALKRLRKILTDRYISEAFEKRSQTRKSQVGQANRNEKIRTYNFNQDRVTDHRLSSMNISPTEKEDTLFDLDGFFASPDRLEGFIKSLQKVEKERGLLDIFNELENKK